MNLRFARRVSADILGVGQSRVWIDPEKAGEVAAAITRDDIRRVIREGKIAKKPPKSNSRGRVRLRRQQIAKGRRRGYGSRKGTSKARNPKKTAWVRSIRAIRARLAALRDERRITRKDYRRLYLMAKGGYFRSVSHLETFIEERGIERS